MNELNQDFMLRQVGDTYFVVDLRDHGAEYHAPLPVNELGAAIFIGISSGKTEEEILKELLEEYEVDEEIIKEDVKSFLKSLRAYQER